MGIPKTMTTWIQQFFSVQKIEGRFEDDVFCLIGNLAVKKKNQGCKNVKTFMLQNVAR